MSQFDKIIGNTPLIKINEHVYGKLETYNPTGSVKDRVISYIVNDAVSNNIINDKTILCEATSGNTGIALSAIAASLGLKCKIFMPSNMSDERKKMMKIFGSEIIESPPNDFEHAINSRDEFMSKSKNSWSPMQFSNPKNIECHRTITAPEICKNACSISKDLSAFVHGSGTGGTIEGVRQFFKKKDPIKCWGRCQFKSSQQDPKIIMVVPDEEAHGIQGIADGKDFLASPDDMDEVIRIKTQDAIDRAELFAKETGILVGISSGANILAAERWAIKNKPSGIVVTMLCDRGERYMSIYDS
jgi:cysteine synthase A